jgi:hypothetical protein
MTIKLFLLAVLFIISGGAAFSEYFKGHKFLSLLATAVAIIATFYLFQDIYDDLKQPSSSTQPPTVPDSPSVSHYRYVDNGDGTVIDNRSGLIWLKNANCFGVHNWITAMQSAANLASGQCGLRDGSRRGIWRLPTLDEWKAMVGVKYMDWENYSQPMLSNAAGTGPWKEGDAFSGVQPDSYWSSATDVNVAFNAWYVNLGNGIVNDRDKKTGAHFVWPVRERMVPWQRHRQRPRQD